MIYGKTWKIWNVRTALLAFSVAALAGCTTQRKETDNSMKPNKEVAIRTPLGDLTMQAKLDPNDMGLKLYPGSRPRPDTEAESNSSNANFNVATSIFGFKLMVQKYESDDAPEQILAFYEKELKQFGKVVKCPGGSEESAEASHNIDAPVGCDTNNEADDEAYETELKVGTTGNQHIVAVKSHGKGTRFALVYVKIRGEKKKA